MSSGIYGQVADGKNNTFNKLKNGIKKYSIYLILLFNIALEILAKCYRVGFKNPFTVEFCVELIISCITTMVTYCCFIPYGKSDEKQRNPSYATNIEHWGALTERVRDGFIELFRHFCFERVDEERREVRMYILANDTLITYETFRDSFLGKSKKEIKQLRKDGVITKREEKAINRANGYGWHNPTKVKPINPLIVLSGATRGNLNDAGRKDSAYAFKWLATRPLLMFCTSTIINAISSTFIGGKNAVFSMFLSVLTILVASVFGYSAGQSEVRQNNDRVKSRIVFLSLFFEQKKIDTKGVFLAKNQPKTA
jgi:hypothetical protein